jgi:hypothetical protein
MNEFSLKEIVSAEDIHARAIQLAQEIDDHCRKEGIENLLLIGILRGAFIFMADLTRKLKTPHIVDFMALASYEKSKSGDVRILMDTREPVSDRHVLIVEDIFDSGNTLIISTTPWANINLPRSRPVSCFKRRSSIPSSYTGLSQSQVEEEKGPFSVMLLCEAQETIIRGRSKWSLTQGKSLI